MVPAGAHVINPVGTAPGVVVPATPTIVVLPGPPRELQPMWRTACRHRAVQKAIAARTMYRQDTVRMFGLPESGLADTLRDAEQSIEGFTASRSPPACGAANSRLSPATSPTPQACTANSWNCCANGTGGTSSPKTAHGLTT